jgi:predicted dehydrogenase
MLRIPTLFAERDFDPSSSSAATRARARRRRGALVRLRRGRRQDWRAVIDDPGVDVVYVAAPNMLHVELVEAAAQAGKHVFCEKPVGGTPEQTVRAESARAPA